MALYSGRLLMRGGNEADFNPDKMLPREWAVSTDKKIVRICVAPGMCIRMATYDAFEEDMAKIEDILKECQTIQEVVVRINEEVSQNADAVAEYTEQAKQYRDDAKRYRDDAFMATPSGYEEVVKNVEKNTVKIDTIIEKADLGIKETASGEEIHLTDSAEGKMVEFALYGKARQNTTSGKNFIPYPYIENTHEDNGITWTDNGDGTITANGTATADSGFYLDNDFTLKAGSYILSGCPSGGSATSYRIQLANNAWNIMFADKGDGVSVVLEEDTILQQFRCLIPKGVVANNLTFKPMIRLASITDDTWEPYTNGASPNPSYPQEIEVAGESYNLIPYPYQETTHEENGIIWTDLGDGRVMANGKATANSYYNVRHRSNEFKVNEPCILTGCPKGGSTSTYAISTGYKDTSNKALASWLESGSGVSIQPYEGEYQGFEVVLIVYSGATVENLIFKPMLRKASVKNDRYMPYGKGSVEVKSVGKNLYDRNKDANRTNVGVTATISDGVMVLNGTATGAGALPAVGEEVNILNAKVGETFTLSVKILDGNANVETKTSLAYLSFRTKSGLNELTKTTGSVTANEKNVDKNTETSSITFTVTENMFNEDGKICVLCMNYIRGTEVFNNLKIGVQLEKGDKATEYQPYKETISTIPTPNGLARKSVSSDGNYTDQNGQQWTCDEIVKYADGSGEYIQRVISEVFDGVTNKVNGVNISTEYGVSFYSSANNNTLMNKLVVKSGNSYDLLCSHFVTKFALYNPSTTKDYGCGIYRTSANIWFSIDKDTASKIGIDVDTATVEQFNLWLQENPVTVLGILAEPIITPLTAEQIAEIEKLSTFYPVTNISNDADCGMKVKYNADSKNYIDNKLALQAKAREEEMMSMFLLLPEETQAKMIENDTNNLLIESEE